MRFLRRLGKKESAPKTLFSFRRRPRIESLEVRRLLAVDFRMMTYNALNFGSGSVDRQDEFQAVFADVNPDIVLMQEITSDVGADLLLDALNAGGTAYSRAAFVNGNDSDHMLFYRTATVDLIAQNYIPTALREFGEYIVDVAGTQFNLYSAHLKASTGSKNEQLRLDEVTILRDHLESLPAGTEFIVAGDMNIYDSAEPAYQKMVQSEPDNSGRLEDLLPSNLIGDWHANPIYAAVHTQSPRTTRFGGGATGGLDDRFDMILVSSGLNDGVGVEYVTNSYSIPGNDGQHFDQSILVGANSSASPAVIQALHDASDHLPVVADFQIADATGAGVTIAESGATAVAEGGGDDTYQVVLNSVPTDNVTVTVTPDGQLDLGGGAAVPISLTFTPANALIPQVVLVNAVDDALDEGTHTSSIQHAVTSNDVAYNGLSVRSVSVSITDNDAVPASIVINEVYVNPPDADDNREYIEIRSAIAAQSLTNLALVEIDGDGTSAGVIDSVQDLSTLSTGSNGLLVLGENYETAAPWTFDPSTTVANLTGTRLENGAISFLLVEGFSGSSGVDLDLNDDGILDVIPWTAVIDSVGWTDGGAADRVYGSLALAETGPHAVTRFPSDMTPSSLSAWYYGSLSGSGLSVVYDSVGASPNMPANAVITPGGANDGGGPRAGVTIIESDGNTSVTEGGNTDQYTIVLDSAPAADVIVTVSPDPQSDLGAGPGVPLSLNFAPTNFDIPQTVTITATDDSIDEGPHNSILEHSVISSDPDYNGIAVENVSVSITDNDATTGSFLDFAISEITTNGVTSGTYQDSYESDDVRESITEELYSGNKRSRLNHQWQFEVTGGNEVTFHLEAYHDSLSEDFQFDLSTDGGMIWSPLLTLTQNTETLSSVTISESVFGSVLVRVTDTDRSRGEGTADTVFIDRMYFESLTGPPVPAIALVESGASTEVGEGGFSDTYTLALETVPDSDVTISVTPDGQLDLGAGPGGSVNLTFTPANALIAQAITVSAVDDTAIEANHTGTISHSVTSADPSYDQLSVRNVTASISDNDLQVGVDNVALAEATSSGTVTGSYLDTHVSDDLVEIVTEELYAGNQRSRLNHQWVFEVDVVAPVSFFAEAYQNSSSEGFQFQYSTNGGSSWTNLFLVESATETIYSAALGNVTGNVLVRVIDTDQTRGENTADSVFVDALYFRSSNAPLMTASSGEAVAVDLEDWQIDDPRHHTVLNPDQPSSLSLLRDQNKSGKIALAATLPNRKNTVADEDHDGALLSLLSETWWSALD